MIDNQSLERALGTLERHAPAEAEVLAGMRRGIARRRRRRQVASVALASGVASTVALGVVLVAPDRTDGAGAPPATAPPSRPPSSAVPAAPAAPVLPFTVGWVPDGYTLNFWDVSPTESSAQYVGTRDFQTVVVRISAKPVDPVNGATDQPATVAGRPGILRKLAPGRDVQLIWQVTDGGPWATVGGMVPPITLDVLHKVAKNLNLRPAPVDMPLGLRSLPAGYQVAGWNSGGGATLCRGAVDLRRESPPDCLHVSVHDGTAPAGTQRKNNDRTIVDVPVDQAKVVDGVPTRASADGTIVFVQVDTAHWAQAFSMGAGVEVLRELAALVTVR